VAFTIDELKKVYEALSQVRREGGREGGREGRREERREGET